MEPALATRPSFVKARADQIAHFAAADKARWAGDQHASNETCAGQRMGTI